MLFALLDVLHRRGRTLSMFKVLELVARVPYQSWEQVAYVAITHVARRPGLGRRIHDRVAQARAQQDNEQWRLLILEGLVARTGKKESRLLYYWIPQSIAFVYTSCPGLCTYFARPGPISSTPTSKITPSTST